MSLAAFIAKVSNVLGIQYGHHDSEWNGLDYSKLAKVAGYEAKGKRYHGTIPADLSGEFTSEGVTIRIAKSEPRLINNRKVKTSKHRVSVQCECGEWIPAGRVHQHAMAKKHGGTGGNLRWNLHRKASRKVSQ